LNYTTTNTKNDLQQIDRIRLTSRQIVRELGFMQNNIAGTKLSASAVHTIIELGINQNVTAKELCKILKLEKSTISRLLKKLHSQQLIELSNHINDSRIRNLGLTKQGWDLFSDIEMFGRNQVANALNTLTGNETKMVTEGLLSYAKALQKSSTEHHNEEKKIIIHEGYKAGLISQVSALFINFFHKQFDFGYQFESKVASELSEFVKRLLQPQNTIYSAYIGNELVATITIDGDNLGGNIAHLRWFIAHPKVTGQGIGKQLLQKAISFVDHHAFDETHLWTIKGLDSASHLYQKHDFKLVEQASGNQWGSTVIEQKFVRPILT